MKSEFKSDHFAIRRKLAPLLSIREVRDVLGVSTEVVTRLIREGKLEGFDVLGRNLDADSMEHPGGVRVSPESLKGFLQKNRIQSQI